MSFVTVTFQACPDCLDVIINSVNGEEFTDSQVRHSARMAEQHPELKGLFTADIETEEYFTHFLCTGCGSPLSGPRREVTIYAHRASGQGSQGYMPDREGLPSTD